MPINIGQLNAPSGAITPGGVTLSEFRQRLQGQLSNYGANTLIQGLGSTYDQERQFINDGIGQLWPYDFQTVDLSVPIIAAQSRYDLPSDCEQVEMVIVTDVDINNYNPQVYERLRNGYNWHYEPSFITASTSTLDDGTTVWTNATHRRLFIDDLSSIGQMVNQKVVQPGYKYLGVKYARRWPSLTLETDSIDPSPQRVVAIVHYAAAQYFMSQYQVNSESIRYRNYLEIAKTELAEHQRQLIKDPRVLYIY